MKIMTLGNGFIANHLPYEKITERIDIDWQKTRAMISHYRPQVLINCIGFCGAPNVDQCEIQKTKTYTANIMVPLLLADLCEKFDCHMIHIGSGCIYFGESPNKKYDCGCNEDCLCDSNLIDIGWKETDFANPKSFYSKTKYSCDLSLSHTASTTVLRVRMPISEKVTQRNLINKLRGYREVIDIPNSVTFMNDLVRCIDWAAQNRPGGIFHVTNPQPLTAARIMREFQKYVPEHQFSIIDEFQLDGMTVAKRSNCILNTEKLNNAGFHMTPSEEALEHCMAEYIKNI